MRPTKEEAREIGEGFCNGVHTQDAEYFEKLRMFLIRLEKALPSEAAVKRDSQRNAKAPRT